MKKRIFLSFLCLSLLVALPLAVVASDYLIGAGDKLQISVWDSPDFSLETLVRPDGKITLPAVGDVEAAGLTTTQLQKRLEKAVARFVKKPIVTVIVTEMTNNKVYISGGAISPGVIPLNGNMTLFRLLCQIDVSDADLVSACLYRNGKVLLRNFYPLFMKGDMKQDVVLKANDIIHIPTNDTNRVYVVGAVASPQAVPYHYGLNVLDAILAAGGFTEYAKQSNITIIRRNGKKFRVNIEDLLSGKDVKQNVPVIPGDYIVVHESMF